MDQNIIPKHGGYHDLLSFQKSEIIFDATGYFTKRFYNFKDRTIDQMVQAARSGKQNIVEASLASATSKETELKLTNVAHASLGELLEDYRDFLRSRRLVEWELDHPYAVHLRKLNKQKPQSYDTFRKGIEHENPEISANVIIGLIKVGMFLLRKQIQRLEKDFLLNGGIRERMTKARQEQRKRDQRT